MNQKMSQNETLILAFLGVLFWGAWGQAMGSFPSEKITATTGLETRTPATVNVWQSAVESPRPSETTQSVGVSESGAELSPQLTGDYHILKMQERPLDLNKYVPGDLVSGQDPNAAASKIADKTFTYWWENSDMKKSGVGRSVEAAQKSVQQDVNLGTQEHPQNLNLGLDLFQTTARVKYEGFAKAEVFYQVRDSSAGVNIVKKLDNTKDLVLGETMRSSDSNSEVKFRWAW
jgi:hypothetical protein